MKPSSSSSSLSFFHSQRSSSGGCMLDVLRRILCSRSLTSDTCSCSDDKMMKDDNQAKVVVPGLVARLMGLDSIPDRRIITRSRSLNSADQLQHRKLNLHRRSKSSREIPTYIELDVDDDDFIVLKFDNRKKSSRTNRKRDNTGASPATLKEEQKQLGCHRHRQQPAETESCNQREPNSRIKKHIRPAQNTTQSTSSDTEESSPVSIFDFQEPTSADDDSWTKSSSSSSRVSSPEQDNTKITFTTSLGDHQNPEEAVEGRNSSVTLLNNTVVINVNGQKKKKREMWGKVCNITVAEIKGADTVTHWWVKEDLAAEFEVHIMDQLLNDLLHSI